jgi:hypothetical protein
MSPCGGTFAAKIFRHQMLKINHQGEDSGFTFSHYYLIIDG